MAIKTIASVKADFTAGAKPTQQNFVDLIDSTYNPEIVVNIVSAASAGSTGFVEITSASGATLVTPGTAGRAVVTAGTAASVRTVIGAGSAGDAVFVAGTQASARSALGLGTAAVQNNGDAALMKVGSVLQTVQTVDVTNRSVAAGGSFADSGLEVSITPSATANKVLIRVNATVGASAAADVSFTLTRGGTALTPAEVSEMAIVRPGANTDLVQLFMEFLDSPGTTSATTYALQWKSGGGTAYLGRRGSDTTYDIASYMTAQEIKG